MREHNKKAGNNRRHLGTHRSGLMSATLLAAEMAEQGLTLFRYFVAEQSREGSATQAAARRPMLKPHPAIEVRFHPQGLPWAGHDGPMAPPLSETPVQIDFHSVTETASDLAHVMQRSVVHTGHQQTMDAFSAPRVTDDHARQHVRRLDLLPGGGAPAWQV